MFQSVQLSCSIISDSATPWTEHIRHPCPSQSLLKLMSIELVMPSNHLLHLCHPLLLLPSIIPSIRVGFFHQVVKKTLFYIYKTL